MAHLDSHLRIAQVILHVLTFSGGLMSCIGLGWDVRIFGDNCPLYSDMKLTQGKNNTIEVNTEETKWGSMNICYYCIFSTVIASIYAIIWFWFYLLLSDWDPNKERFSFYKWTEEEEHNRSPPDLKLFFPTLFFNLVLLVCVLLSLGLLTAGSQVWCDSIMKTIEKQCSYLRSLMWSNDFKNGNVAYTYLQVAQAGCWILVLSQLGIIVIIGCRLHLYFRPKDLIKDQESTEQNDVQQSSRVEQEDISQELLKVSPGHLNQSFSSDEVDNSDAENVGEDTSLKTQLLTRYNTL